MSTSFPDPLNSGVLLLHALALWFFVAHRYPAEPESLLGYVAPHAALLLEGEAQVHTVPTPAQGPVVPDGPAPAQVSSKCVLALSPGVLTPCLRWLNRQKVIHAHLRSPAGSGPDQHNTATAVVKGASQMLWSPSA